MGVGCLCNAKAKAVWLVSQAGKTRQQPEAGREVRGCIWAGGIEPQTKISKCKGLSLKRCVHRRRGRSAVSLPSFLDGTRCPVPFFLSLSLIARRHVQINRVHYCHYCGRDIFCDFGARSPIDVNYYQSKHYEQRQAAFASQKRHHHLLAVLLHPGAHPSAHLLRVNAVEIQVDV